MYGQFMTDPVMIRILGEDGQAQFPLIEKDDVLGKYDFKATVIPSISGKNDIDKKQNMDLFQLLVNLPFVDLRKLAAKVLKPWKWTVESVSQEEQPQQGAVPGMMPGQDQMMPPGGDAGLSAPPNLKNLPPEIVEQLMQGLPAGPAQQNPFQELSSPVNLMNSPVHPTARGIPQATANPRGLSRGGKVNSNLNINQNSTPESNLLNRVFNTQR